MEESLHGVAFVPPPRRRMSRTQTLRGVLVSVEPGDDDETERMALLTDHGLEYLVEGGASERLVRHLDKGVIAWGSVRRDGRGARVLKVRGFEIVSWEEP